MIDELKQEVPKRIGPGRGVQLRITHMLMWMLFTFTVYGAVSLTALDAEKDIHLRQSAKLFTAITGVLYGGVIAGTVALAGYLRRNRTEVEKCLPGHWLVLFFVFPFSMEVLALLGSKLLALCSDGPLVATDAITTLVYTVASIGQIVICLCAFTKQH